MTIELTPELEELKKKFIVDAPPEPCDPVLDAVDKCLDIARKYRGLMALKEEFGGETTFRPIADQIIKEIVAYAGSLPGAPNK